MLWWFIEPLLYMSVFVVLFAVGLRKGGIDSVPFFLTGLVPWKWFATCVSRAGGVLESNGNIIKQIKLPIFIFPSVTVFINTFKFLLVFSILILYLMGFTNQSYAVWWSLPVILAVQLLFTASLVFWLAAVVPIIPDLQNVVQNLLTLLFFLSGIFFDISMVDERVSSFLKLNPVAMLIDSYRAVLVHGRLPDFSHLSVLVICSGVLLFGAIRFLSWYAHEYPKIIR